MSDKNLIISDYNLKPKKIKIPRNQAQADYQMTRRERQGL